MGYMLRTRFAPTPSGYLHLGNAWSLVLTWLAARSQKGWIYLRIDDLDAARLRGEYVEDLFASLQWLGLDWDQGPRSPAEFHATYSQHLRREKYHAALTASGLRDRLYACACSRETSRRAVRNGSGIYPGTCRALGLPWSDDRSLRYRLAAGEAVSARDAHGKTFALHPDRDIGDFVVRRKNGAAGYQLASVIDDEDARINFVVRGLDLMPSTGAQLTLARAMGCTGFSAARFWHHSLVMNQGGGKLSKSAGGAEKSEDTLTASLRALRQRWPQPAPLYRFFARQMGCNPDEVHTIHDLLPTFHMEKISDTPLRFGEWSREWGRNNAVGV